MPVRKVGDDESAVKRVTCRNCGSILEYLPCDVQHKTYSDYDGGSDTISSINCPQCKGTVRVK